MTVFLLGLDGASLENLRSEMERSDLPNFKRVIAEGYTSALRSVYPYVTAPAWTSLFSGVNPGRHGIFDLIEVVGDRVEVPNMRRLDTPLLWEYLSWAGKKVLAMGIPFIHPAPLVNGTFITGRLVPELSCTPLDVKSRYDLSGFAPELDRSRLAGIIHGESNHPRKDKSGYTAALVEALANRVKASLALIDSDKWDAVLIVDSLPDQLFHTSYSDRPMISRMFGAFDEWLGEIIKRMDKTDTLMVVSDHGFGDVTGVFFLNEWLRSKSYVKVDDPLSAKISRLGPARRASRAMKRLGFFVTQSARGKSESGSEQQPNQPKERRETAIRKPVEGSKVVARGVAVSAWIQLLATDEGLEDSIIRELAEVKEMGLAKNVFKTRELYSGRYSSKAPGQLLVEPGEGWSVDTERITFGSFFKRFRSQKGGHRPEGILMIFGKSPSAPKGSANICDITPTILDLMRLPIPPNLDGTSLFADSDGAHLDLIRS
ncbi:MAG: alkaline phosphatase family protein [Nitrososphaerales archaeon]|jgi:predicted AlkP superfamily phosphohydrolase/phosphomutase